MVEDRSNPQTRRHFAEPIRKRAGFLPRFITIAQPCADAPAPLHARGWIEFASDMGPAGPSQGRFRWSLSQNYLGALLLIQAAPDRLGQLGRGIRFLQEIGSLAKNECSLLYFRTVTAAVDDFE